MTAETQWRLVPVTPNSDMLVNWLIEEDGRRAWRQFLAAAPPPPLPDREAIARIIYEANPMGDQETDLDGRPAGPGYTITWDDLLEYDAGIREGVMETADAILALLTGRTDHG